MSAIIELSDGSCIAGEPPASLGLGEHWCEYCCGDGLEYGLGFDDETELQICSGCWGRCVRDCEDTACLEHSTLHPVGVVFPSGHDEYSRA